MSVLSKTGFSGRRENRDPVVAMMLALEPVTQPIAAGVIKLRFLFTKADESKKTRAQKAEDLAKELGYASYSQCEHLVDDMLPLEAE